MTSRRLASIGEKRITLASAYYAVYAVWLVATIVLNSTDLRYATDASRVFTVVQVAVVCSLALIALLQRYSYRSLALIVLCLIVFGLSWQIAKWRFLLVSFMFIITFERCNVAHLAKVTFASLIVGIALVIGMSYFGMVIDSVVYREGLARHTYGFNTSNTLGMYLLEIAAAWVVFHWERISFRSYLVLAVFFFVSYFLCGSRSMIACGFVLLVMVAIARNSDRSSRLLKVSPWLIVVLCIVSLYMAVWYTNRFALIDSLSSTRLSQMHSFYSVYGFSLFGRYVPYADNERIDGMRLNVVDNAYGHVAILFGLIPLILFVVLYFLTMKKAVRENCLPIIVVLATFAILGLFETGLYRIQFNFALTAIGYLVFNKPFAASSSRETSREPQRVSAGQSRSSYASSHAVKDARISPARTFADKL